MVTTENQVEVRDVAGGLRALLRGIGPHSDNKWVRGLRAGRESNVLFAGMLHAAERRAHGMAPTEIEQALLDIMDAVMTVEETAVAAAEYRSAVEDLGEVALLPKVVTGMPVAQGFTLDDFLAHLPVMQAENEGRDNCEIVDVSALAAGAPFDSERFQAAVNEFGFGASLLTGPPPDDASAEAASAVYNARIEFEKFTCYREVGDGMNGRDEVFWSVAARSDKHKAPIYDSEEFGAVTEGDVREFDADKKVVFDGPAGKFVTLGIYVWEADDSRDQWYDELHNGLRAWLNKPMWAQVISAFLPGPQALVILEGLAQVFTNLKEALRDLFENANDLSCERVILIDRNALVTLYHRRDALWHFNGDGHHGLQVAYTGDQPVFPTGALEYVTVRPDDGVSVGAPVSMGWESSSPPELCSFGGNLHCMYIRPGDRAVMWSVCEDGVWRAPVVARNGWRSDYRPALAEHNGILHAVLVVDGELFSSRLNGHEWAPTERLHGQFATQAPSMAVWDSMLRCVFVKDDDNWNVCYMNFDDNAAGGSGAWMFTAQATATKTREPVAAAGARGYLWMAFRDRNQAGGLRLTYKERYDTNETDNGVPTGWSTLDGPALTHLDHDIWMAVRRDRGQIRVARTVGGGLWLDTTEITNVRAMEGSQPALVAHDGVLYVMYQR
ncbi:hypothetical protein [Streptomyces xanthophaeus]